MKKKFTLLLILTLFSAYNIIAQVTGVVTLNGPNDFTGIKVLFINQATKLSDSVITSASGEYSIVLSKGHYKIIYTREGFDTVIYNGGESIQLEESTVLENVMLQESYFSNNRETATEAIITISGLVHKGSGFINNGIVMVTNRAENKTTIGKVNTDGSFLVDTTNSGQYYIYAVPDPSLEGVYLPTYYVNSVAMMSSASISSSGSVSGVDIYLVEKTASVTGSALLEGRFSYYQNLGNDDNTDFSRTWFNNTYTPTSPIQIFNNPCKNMPVLLFNSEGKIVAFAVTDQQGYYAFKNLPGGNYRIEGQRYRFTTQFGGFVNIAASGTTQTNLQMVSDFVVTGLNNSDLSNESLISYPNPFQEKLYVPTKGQLIITDITGNVFLENTSFEGGEIQTEKWPKGVYLVKCAGSVSKILKN